MLDSPEVIEQHDVWPDWLKMSFSKDASRPGNCSTNQVTEACGELSAPKQHRLPTQTDFL